MTVDQYETVRLIDLEGLTQEACTEKMQTARAIKIKILTRRASGGFWYSRHSH